LNIILQEAPDEVFIRTCKTTSFVGASKPWVKKIAGWHGFLICHDPTALPSHRMERITRFLGQSKFFRILLFFH
jgi:hypothetical protein